MDEKYLTLSEALRDGEDDDALEAAKELLDAGTGPLEIFTQCVEPTLNDMGEQFANLEIFLPDLMLAGNVVHELQDMLLPIMEAQNIESQVKGTVVIATVNGDIHDIGKNMVALMLQINGYDVHDIGVDVTPVAIAQKAEELNADLVALSGLMMPSLPYMQETITLVKSNAKLKDHTLVMVGGGPVTLDWANSHGADGYADDAMGAVHKANELMKIAQ